MSTPSRLLALRSSKGTRFCNGPPSEGEFQGFPCVEGQCHDMTFTKDGSLFAWCTTKVYIASGKSFKTVQELDQSKVSAMEFSPKGTYLSTWETYAVKDTPQESCNLHIWNVSTGACVKSFIQKKQSNWKPQWTEDEHICARSVNNEVQFYEDADFSAISKKIFLQKVVDFSLAPGIAPYHITCFVPGIKGQPSFVKLFMYPKFEGPGAVLAQKSFYKAERSDFFWNKTGQDCLLLSTTDVDKTGASYYGEMNLYYISVKTETAKVKLGKEGPIYSLQWSPHSKEFCVVYGYMPAKATIYNLKCDPVFDFGMGSRNEILYSPVGNRLSLSGFGNLQGNIEVWDLKEKKQVSQFVASDSTCIQWSPDGEHILTATTFPRLRIGNGYRVWHYTGSLLQEIFLDTTEELYFINWKPVPKEDIRVTETQYKPVPGIQSVKPQVSKQVYRPPGAQGKPSSFKLHEDEPPVAKNDVANKGLSKSQKRKMSKKAKQEEKESQNAKPDALDEAQTEKKIRNLFKKLQQIERLKKEKEEGKSLDADQLEKIKKQKEIEEEIAKLRI